MDSRSVRAGESLPMALGTLVSASTAQPHGLLSHFHSVTCFTNGPISHPAIEEMSLKATTSAMIFAMKEDPTIPVIGS